MRATQAKQQESMVSRTFWATGSSGVWLNLSSFLMKKLDKCGCRL